MKTIFAVLATAMTLLFVVFLFFRMVAGVQFDRQCGGHLKRAADANTVELAKQELQFSLDYLEREQMTSGYTSLLYQTPNEDIGFWYGNLKASMAELNQITPESSLLEKSNVLLKLRETLLDGGKNGESLTAPAGIAVYPYNWVFCLGLVIPGLLAALGWALLVWAYDQDY